MYESSPLPPIQRRHNPHPTPPGPLSPSVSSIAAASTGILNPNSPPDASLSSPATKAPCDYCTIEENTTGDQPDETIPVNPGFLGSTSYSSIFVENLEHLGIPGVPAVSNDVRLVSSNVCSELVTKGVEVLRIFCNKALINRFHDRLYELDLGLLIPESIGKGWRDCLWSTYGTVLTAGKADQLHPLSESIWCNTLKPVKIDGTTSLREWVDLTSGPNLRWPVLGILACLVGIASRTLISSDPIFVSTNGTMINSKRLAVCMWEAAEACIAFCRDYEIIDDLFVMLLSLSYPFTTSIRGDTSKSIRNASFIVLIGTGYLSYQRSGELMNAIVAMGLHGEIKVDKNTPFFLAQLRGRALFRSYAADTSLGTFLGRPPRLSYRFCILEPPADIDDSALLLEGDEWKEALTRLDENGWNTAGRITRQTWQKAYANIAKSREDILEIALTRLPPEELLRRAETIRRRTDEQFAQFPTFIQKEWTQPWYELRSAPALRTLFIVSFRLGYLSNDLLLQRVLVKSAGADHWTLVEIARGLFKEVLKFVSRADLTRDFQIDLSWILVAHGIRSAAIVAVQLLKQEMFAGPPEDQRLPRSETIQDLSVFASCLSAIDRDDGNYSVCDQGQRVIKRMLDKILELPAKQPAQVDSLGHHESVPMFEPFGGFGGPSFDLDASVSLVNDADFVQWLESVDWDKSGMEAGMETPFLFQKL